MTKATLGNENLIPAEFLNLVEAWRIPQVQLSQVRRWLPYEAEDPPDKRRPTNVLEHTASVTLLAEIVCNELYDFHLPMLDRGLVISAFIYHDIPEGLLGRDVLFPAKTTQHDVNEHKAFAKMLAELCSQRVLDGMMRAYLLQYAYAEYDISVFPEEAQTVLKYLRENKSVEVRLFHTLELMDYIMYVIEQYHQQGNWMLATRILMRHLPQMEAYASQIEGFRAVVWKNDISRWCHGFLAVHKPLHEEAVRKHKAGRGNGTAAAL